MEQKRLCPFCMGELPPAATVCPHCGKILEGCNPAGCLPVGTVLAGRYTVGEMRSLDGEGVLYSGVENLGAFRVTIKEYLPVTLSAERGADCVLRPKQGSEVLFKTTRMDFADLYRAIQRITPASGLEAVLDVVYNPFRTELLLRAEDHHIPAASGFEMLVAQAVFAAEHFTGKALDADTLIPAVSRRLRHELANISIIGMPGCGKSTIGAALAKKLGKTFIDLDAEIERRTGHNIPDIFAQEGEAAFRQYEAETLADVAKQNRQIIACGGGIIKTPANVRALRQNGPVLWVRRPIEKLATGGRPLSKGGAALKQLEEERTPLYEAAASVVLDNTGTLREAADKAAALFEADETL